MPQASNPLSYRTVAYFAIWLHQSGYAYNTIKSYVGSLSTLWVLLGVSIGDSRLERATMEAVIRGVRRLAPVSRGPKLPLPFKSLVSLVDALPPSPKGLAFKAALLSGFFGMLRASNLVPRSRKDCHQGHFLRRSDVVLGSDGATLRITRSKTNQFGARRVTTKLPFVEGSPYCPSSSIKALLAAAPGHGAAPLFSWASGAWVSYEDLLTLLKSLSGGVPGPFGTHSLRRGGATFAASLGVSAFHIKLQGDWSSDCFLRYVIPSSAESASAPVLFAAALSSFK